MSVTDPVLEMFLDILPAERRQWVEGRSLEEQRAMTENWMEVTGLAATDVLSGPSAEARALAAGLVEASQSAAGG
ncbi:hypothetical protein LHJ74_02590 [Streptomyces sp. N2-109]|uniref:Uncharacterized protein n=1 Tax=Streptomyces gossypii TaxID=2883101 RepID=A0ABT2JLT0_9ACTN|nr:hypothetical protein [Streptomyces gossypii]MCT2588833.1 hypothetical protein [Streptomyces gossypii]